MPRGSVKKAPRHSGYTFSQMEVVTYKITTLPLEANPRPFTYVCFISRIVLLYAIIIKLKCCRLCYYYSCYFLKKLKNIVVTYGFTKVEVVQNYKLFVLNINLLFTNLY